MSKHTKGPWKSGPPATGLDPLRERYIHAGGELVARAIAGYLHFENEGGKYWNIDIPTLDANARLIAASPDMYAALEAVQALFAREGFYIAKADCAEGIIGLADHEAIDATFVQVAAALRAAGEGK